MTNDHYNAQLLVEWREATDQTQEQVARDLDRHVQTIHRAETGKQASFYLLNDMCAYYGKTVQDILKAQPV